MAFDGSDAQIEGCGDLLVGKSFCQEGEDLLFALSQLGAHLGGGLDVELTPAFMMRLWARPSFRGDALRIPFGVDRKTAIARRVVVISLEGNLPVFEQFVRDAPQDAHFHPAHVRVGFYQVFKLAGSAGDLDLMVCNGGDVAVPFPVRVHPFEALEVVVLMVWRMNGSPLKGLGNDRAAECHADSEHHLFDHGGMEDILDVGSQLYENLFKIRFHTPVLLRSRVHVLAVFLQENRILLRRHSNRHLSFRGAEAYQSSAH